MKRNKIRFGLCCIFNEHPIRFRMKQAKYILKFDRSEQLKILSETILENTTALIAAVSACRAYGIGSFRINSKFFPLKTHPDVRYGLEELPGYEEITAQLNEVHTFCKAQDLRLTFHPDQFILLSSPKADVIKSSIEELLYHDELSELIGADVINIHAGGIYGNKAAALKRLKDTVAQLPDSLKSRLTFENDDRSYTPDDLLPVCHDMRLPMVYDIHHHRCLTDNLSEEEATTLAIQTWDREPLFHLSSPKAGWGGKDPKPHSDMIDVNDFPEFWKSHKITVDIEAKAKETAIVKLQYDLGFRK